MIIPLILGILVGILTSYTDIKTSYIYEERFFPSFSLLSKWWCKRKGCNYEVKGPYIPIVEAGILYYFFLGIKNEDLILAFSGIIGLLLGFAVGSLLYYTGGWASGDVLILAAFSSLLPYAPESAKYKAPYAVVLPLNALTILFNSILLIFPLIFVYAFAGLIAKKKLSLLKELFVKGIRNVFEVSLWIMFSVTLFVVISINLGISLHPLLRWILTFLLIAFLSKIRVIGDILGVLSLVYVTYLVGFSSLYFFLRLVIILYAFKLLLSSVKMLRKEVLTKVKRVEELKEGEVLGERILEVGGKIVRDRKDFFEKLNEVLKSGKFEQISGKEIAGFSVEGLTKEQIEELKKLVSEGKLENEFLVRKAMPFAPALFLGVLTSYFFGDILWWIILKVSGMV
ncbi:transposase [Pyrococcus furiosus DSM 3638]|uniref:Peptidase A24A-predicted C-terminal archaea domain-containing protein n=3 Tax=Pyrococcus furiosus TaxID=2261 RepID=Q8U3J5_PYRFU|nr:A24 family peptidase C-terminal domain-containing protein [Pyrococcus furiosus]AAL80595.1 hypothetical protein PF0471 [Pyrococcus furiosus DSM 3638]AFN03265.1 hypothetical protein PFC_01470 [Pyrococcus furiosus COM1]QEK78184.1 transposase [Pyrococcus furiosus DSM 3638]